MPCYNNTVRLNQSIGSLLQQNDKRFKLLFNDDASSDESVDMAKSLLRYSGLDYQVTQHQSRKGWLANFQTLYRKIETEYFLYLDCEDTLSNNYVSVVNQIIGQTSTSGNFDFLAPKYLELGENSSTRRLLAAQQLNQIPYGIRLPHYLTLPSMAGIGYYIYSVQNFKKTEHIWQALWKETDDNPTKHLVEDIALSWALLSDCPNYTDCSDQITLAHFCKAEVDQTRLLLNEVAYQNIVGTTAPEIILEALELFKKISQASSEAKRQAEELVITNYRLKFLQQKLSEALSGKFNTIALLKAGTR